MFQTHHDLLEWWDGQLGFSPQRQRAEALLDRRVRALLDGEIVAFNMQGAPLSLGLFCCLYLSSHPNSPIERRMAEQLTAHEPFDPRPILQELARIR